MLQFKKKVSQNRTKLQQTTNNNKQQQTTNNKRPFFLPKINKVFLRPILQNLKGRSVLDKFFFENDPLDEPNQMPPSKKFYLLSKLVKNAKWWSKSSLPLSHSTAKFFPLKKGFKKRNSPPQKYNIQCTKQRELREVCFMVPFLKIHAEQDALGPKSLQRSVQELVFWLISR